MQSPIKYNQYFCELLPMTLPPLNALRKLFNVIFIFRYSESLMHHHLMMDVGNLPNVRVLTNTILCLHHAHF